MCVLTAYVDCDKTLLSSIANIIKQLKQHYDISNKCIETLINSKQISFQLKFLYQQINTRMINDIKQSNMESKHKQQIYTESCGKINKIHSNGYIEFCSLSKHEHKQDKCTHNYVNKTDTQESMNRQQNNVYKIYKYYVNMLCSQSYKLLEFHLHKRSLSIDKQSQKTNEFVFKNKSGELFILNF